MDTIVRESEYAPETCLGTPEEVERIIQEVVERLFGDEEGLLRSGENGRTRRSLKEEEEMIECIAIATTARLSLAEKRRVWVKEV